MLGTWLKTEIKNIRVSVGLLCVQGHTALIPKNLKCYKNKYNFIHILQAEP
jgi:hypothetical protein